MPFHFEEREVSTALERRGLVMWVSFDSSGPRVIVVRCGGGVLLWGFREMGRRLAGPSVRNRVVINALW